METSTQQKVTERRVVIFANIAMASQASIDRNVLPTKQEIVEARARFMEVGVRGAALLINTILKMESQNRIVGYICFSFTVLKDPGIHQDKVESEHIKKLMHLPCTSFGKRDGSSTVLRDMIKLSHNQQLATLTRRQSAFLSLGFGDTSRLLVKATGLASLQ